MHRLHGVLFFGLVWLPLAGCTSAFDRDWHDYVATGLEDPLVGRWKGFWRSDKTEHRGDLRCIVSRRAEGRYEARYHATHGEWWTFNFEYTVLMDAKRTGDVWKLEGSEDLGWAAGGVYHYRGEVSGNEFRCLYSAEEDRGVFELIRYAGEDPHP